MAMETQKVPYEMQIFVCTNDRQGAKASCGDNKGIKVFRALRNIAKERGLHPNIRIAQATCLGQCNKGVNVMVYPGGIWHSCVSEEDVQNCADQYLK